MADKSQRLSVSLHDTDYYTDRSDRSGDKKSFVATR